MKNDSVFIPFVFFVALAGLVGMIAKTSLFSPLVAFIHSPAGSFWQLVLCVMVGIGALWLTYHLLNILCGHYAPRFDEREKERGKT